MWLSCLTFLDSVVGESSSEEFAAGSVLPHIDSGSLAPADLASWHSSRGERSWESESHQSVERSANWLSSWFLGADGDLSSVFDPLATRESVPHVVDILVDITTMMPEALIPSPASSGEAMLGWAPVVPFVVIPSIPDLFSWRPLPDDLWCWSFLTPVADSAMASVFLNKVKTFRLCGKNVFVLSVDPLLGVTISLLVRSFDILLVFVKLLIFAFFELNKGVLVDGTEIFLAKFLHLSILLKELLID